MKRILFLALPIMTLFYSCNGDSQKVSSESKELSSELREFLMKDYNEATQLFAAKYNISEKNSKLITAEYIKIFDPVMQQTITGIDDDRFLEKFIKPDESISEFIDRLTILSGEPKNIVSSYVIDLKLYMKSLKGND